MRRISGYLVIACVIAILFGVAWIRHGERFSSLGQGAKGMDLQSILFTLPTICDEAPETIQIASHDNPAAVHLHEDDWRQIEFIAATDMPQVDREMTAIKDFKYANRAGAGWKSVYIRKERPDGLFPTHLPYGLIDSISHGPIQALMIETMGQQATVKGGFAVRLSPTLIMYGRQSRGILVNLALTTAPDQKESVQYQDLVALCKKFDLIIADWCAGRVVARP